MESSPPKQSLTRIGLGSARLAARNVELPPYVVLDEVTLDGSDIDLPLSGAACEGLRLGEVRFSAVLSEANLNRALADALPADAPIRNLRAAVLTGRVRLSAQMARLFGMPVTLEAIPIVENGVKLSLDWKSAKVGVPLPAPLTEVVEQQLNRAVDLTRLPFPIWVEEIRCEPGRLTAKGRARLSMPLETAPPAPRLPFGPQMSPTPAPPVDALLEAAGDPIALATADSPE